MRQEKGKTYRLISKSRGRGQIDQKALMENIEKYLKGELKRRAFQ